jgi:hypothetical protein
MSTTTPTDIEQRVAAHIAARVSCRVLSAEDGRVGCVTPLQYADGDNVVVWIRPRIGDEFEVSDYGEALAESVWGRNADRRALEEFAADAAEGQGARFVAGRLFAECGWEDLGECVWRVAMASVQIAQVAGALRPRAQRESAKESEFATTVEQGLRSLRLDVKREKQLVGASGHRHRATIYLPAAATVIEPVAGHFNQVYAVYAKLGDLGRANGHRLYSLLDDRETKPGEDVSGMLVQVSNVVEWTRRQEWLVGLLK